MMLLGLSFGVVPAALLWKAAPVNLELDAVTADYAPLVEPIATR
jgi:hypothetical protein